MKRLSTLFFVACLFTLTAFAREISAEQSLRKAVETMGEKSYAKQVRGKADFALVYTQKSAQNGKSLYYVFSNEKDGGFVITGADHRANSVLGYTENGTYEQALAIPAFRSWLSGCEAAMQWLSDNEDAAVETALVNIPDQVVANADNTVSLTIPGRRYVEDPTLPASVEPLLGGIVWDQREPFDRLCPDTQIEENGKKKTVRSATGCVATATAQVMKYWEWPKQGTGSFKYTSQGSVPVELEADFSQSVYDWEHMLDDYSGDFTEEQGNAVAKLMSDVGIGERMSYDYNSGTAHHWTTYALATYFGYNKGIRLCNHSHYTYAEWNDLLKTELSQSRPIVIGGDNYYQFVGHEFVVDGYNEDGNYHVNWGWNGMSNGYYDINYLNPVNQGTGGSMGSYPANQQVNINCFPDTDGTSVAHYEIMADYEPSMLPDGTLQCAISNIGLAPYSGEIGYVVVIDETIVGGATLTIDGLAFMEDTTLTVAFVDLGVTPEMVGDKKGKIYPVFTEDGHYKVPLSKVAFQSYVLFGFDAEGKVVEESAPEDNAKPVCKSFEITRGYAGFNVKAKAVVANEEGSPTFDRGVIMHVVDDNGDVLARGRDFYFIEGGSDQELEFNCELQKDKVLEAGKTYKVYLYYDLCNVGILIPGSESTITMKDPGGTPSLSFSDFAFDKTVIAPKEDITVSFNVENTGGFGIETFALAVFKDGVELSLAMFLFDPDLPAGTTFVTKTQKMDFGEGKYLLGVFLRDGSGEWDCIIPEYYEFIIKDSSSAITNVTDNANVSNRYHDLQGRRVANPTKGLYVVDGKKVVK